MLIAVIRNEQTGRKMLVLGLSDLNMTKLRNDEPIAKNMGEEGVAGLEEWDLVILGPEDLVRFCSQNGMNPMEES
jgi:hypothetical protein